MKNVNEKSQMLLMLEQYYEMNFIRYELVSKNEIEINKILELDVLW